MSSGQAHRSLSPHADFFSSAQLDVVLVAVGAADAEFHRRSALVEKYTTIHLKYLKSFYREETKSPFKSYPWRSGVMHFRFVSGHQRAPSTLGCLHASRATRAAVGLLSASDLDALDRLEAFENDMKGSADLIRCFVFDTDDEDDGVHKNDDEDRKQKLKAHPKVVLLPPGLDTAHLSNQLEIVMYDFAASMLNVLEQKILTVSPSTVSLDSYVDSPAFLGSGLSAVIFSTEDEASRTKRKYGRVQKAMGDYALLAGSPMDAIDHYNTALELARGASDWIYVAAALEGIVSSKLLHEATSNDAFPTSADSVFSDGGDPAGAEATTAAGAAKAADTSMDPFGRRQFWDTLRHNDALHDELSKLLDDCKAAIRKRPALPMLVESELRYARLLAGLKATEARNKVCKLAASVQRAAEILPLPEDRLVALMEAASVLGSVGASRKRVLLLWQAVELSKFFGFPEERTLAVARRALEHKDEHQDERGGRDSEWSVFRKPLSQETNIPDSWGLVKAGILEATLGLAIYANRHVDVWDAAAALLRQHSALLSPHRIGSLYDNLKAASSNMSPADKMRPGLGPPPVVYLVGPEPLKGERTILVLNNVVAHEGSVSDRKSSTPFLYDAFASKKQGGNGNEETSLDTYHENDSKSTRWIRGEAGRINLDLYNESPVTMKIARLVLEATIDGLPATKYQWKPKVVSLTVPPTSRPVRITLEATPMVEGEFVLTGCRMTSSEGVSWHAPWSVRPLEPLEGLNNDLRRVPKASGHATLRALPPLPMATLGVAAGVYKDARGAVNEVEENHGNDETSEKRQDTDVVSTTSVVKLLRGHQAKCSMTLTNVGSVPIGRATLIVARRAASPNDDKNKMKNKSGQIDIDTQVLADVAASLPLAPGESVDIPITFHIPRSLLVLGEDPTIMGVTKGAQPATALTMSTAGTSTPAVTVSFDVTVEYAGASVEAEIGSSCLGRRAQCPLEVAVMPSIELADLSTVTTYSPERCFLSAGVVNRSNVPLRTACCFTRRDESDADCEDGAGGAVACGREVVIAPGQLRHLVLDMTPHASDICDTFGSQERIFVRFGRLSEALDGTCALPSQVVRASLTPEVLSMLRPSDVSISFRFDVAGTNEESSEDERDKQGLPRAMHASFDGSRIAVTAAASAGMPVVVARVGDTLGVTVKLSSTMNVPCQAKYNVRALPITLQARNVDTINTVDTVDSVDSHATYSSSIVPVVDEGWEHVDYDAALDLGMAWNGLVQDAVAELPAKGTATHGLSLSCWTPGWFKLELFDVRIHDIQAAHGTELGQFVSLSVVSASAAMTNARVTPAFLHVMADQEADLDNINVSK